MTSTEHDGKFPIGLAVTFMQYLRMLGNARLRQVVPSGLQNWRTSRRTRAAAARLLAILPIARRGSFPVQLTPNQPRRYSGLLQQLDAAQLPTAVFHMASQLRQPADLERYATKQMRSFQPGIAR